MLLAAPRSPHTAMVEATHDIAVRNRLRLPVAQEGATFTCFTHSSERTCGTTLSLEADHATQVRPFQALNTTPRHTRSLAQLLDASWITRHSGASGPRVGQTNGRTLLRSQTSSSPMPSTWKGRFAGIVTGATRDRIRLHPLQAPRAQRPPSSGGEGSWRGPEQHAPP